MAIYTVHGGHAKQGNKYHGAVGFCAESVVDRAVCASVIKWLQYAGHKAYDCTVDSGISQGNIITKIKKNINSHKNATCNISIHLNAATKTKADGKVKGSEVLVYSTSSEDAKIANRVCLELKSLGFTNRGVKKRTDLGILKGITNGGKNILVECFFCDDEDDYKLFNKLGVDAIGKAIASGVLGKALPSNLSIASNLKYIYKNVNYAPVFDPQYYLDKNPDVAAAVNKGITKAFQHFVNFGMSEGRVASPEFNVKVYKERYSDLKEAFGTNLPAYYEHYCLYGRAEGRKAI